MADFKAMMLKFLWQSAISIDLCWPDDARKMVLQASSNGVFILSILGDNWPCYNRAVLYLMITKTCPGVGVTKAPFANFSISKTFDIVKHPLDSLNHIHISRVSP